MRKRSRYFGGVVVFVSLLGFTGNAGAESYSLELKKVDTSSSSRENYLYRATSSQHFYRPIGEGIRFRDDQDSAKFADIIKKEPGSYQAKHPIRGVIKLGSKSFGYVLDSSVKATGDQEEKEEKVEEREEAKAEESGGLLSNLARMLTGGKKPAEKVEPFQAVPYDRLYFDHDGDGDLTDEKIVEADSTSNYEERNYFSTSFPRIDVPIEIESAKLDFAFTLRVTAYASGDHGYVTGSVNAAAYREGEITLGGKKHRLVLIDFNSNGRFDDVPEVNTSIRTSDNRVYASSGDRLYVDPDMGATSRSPYDITSGDDLFDVSKLIHLDGRFYEMTVSPSGDKLTLEPSAVAIGYVANPTEDFCAVVYGDLGLVKIRSDESGKAPLPAGSWKLKNYTLDRTGFEQKKADPKAEPSILGVLAEALGPTVEARAPRSTIVSATATTKYEAVEVKQDETVDLPFGPPYRPMVDIEYRQGTNQVSLGMSLIGSAGETCTDMRINGNQPGKPKFTIATADGKTVAEGEFEYG
jgi:hypothetical protein